MIPTIKIDTAKLKNGDEVLAVTSPYLASFVAGARKLDGRWSDTSKRWLFDRRDRAAVEQLLYRCYGTSDSATASLCTLRVTLPMADDGYELPIDIAGRTLVSKWGKLGEGVRVLEGRITHAGSRKHPTYGWVAGTVLLVRDVILTANRRLVYGATEAVVEQIEEETDTTRATEVRP